MTSLSLLVVPSRRAASQEIDRRLLDGVEDSTARPDQDRPRARAEWSRDVVTLPDLLRRGLTAHEAPRGRLTRIARALLLDELVDALEPEVRRLFGPGIAGSGASGAIGAALAEIRMAGLAAEDLIAPSRGSRRVRALACALDAYERRLAALDVWDDADAYREAAGVIRRGEWPGQLDALEVRGLYKVTRVEGDLLVALARQARRVRIHVPFEPHEEEATAYAFTYLHLWEEVVDPGLDIEIVHLPPPDDSAREISIEPAADPADEARRLAAWVRRRVEEGCPLEEVGVVVAGGAGIPPRLVRELRRRGVPCQARRGDPLAETPFFAALTLPFRLLEESFPRAGIEAWVATPLTAELDPDALLPAVAGGPVEGGPVEAWRRVLERAEGPGTQRLAAALRGVDELRSAERSPAGFWELYESILDRAGLSRSVVEEETWSRWEEILGELRDALVELDRWEAPPLGWRTHLRHLRRAIGDRRTRIGRPGRGVSLLTPYDARGLGFRHCAVVGLTQGALVGPHPAAAVFGDRERERLNDHLGERRFRTTSEEAKEGSLLLTDRIRSVAGELRLSWPVEDLDGVPRLPALEVARMGNRADLDLLDTPVPSVAPAWRVGARPGRVAELQRVERDRSRFFGRPVESRRGTGTRHDGIFDPDAAGTLAGSLGEGTLGRWSASALESWRQCPHQFFQRYILRVRPPEDRPLEADARTVGILAHRALQRLHERGPDRGVPDADRIAEAVEAEAGAVGEAERGDPAVWDATSRRVTGVLVRYFEYLAKRLSPDGFRPIAFELEFGPDPDSPTVAVETSRGTVDLVGRLDRLDRDGTGRLRVVDYKYSRTRRSHREAVDEDRCGVDRFQLFAYFLGARAWAHAKRIGSAPVVSGTVHCLRQPQVVGSIVSPGPETIRDRIAATIEEAVAGGYDPSPRDADECAWCDYRRSCRIASSPGPEPAAADPEDEA